MEPKLSIVIAVLDSHEVVRRQILHFTRMKLSVDEVEFFIIDDGSDPSLHSYISSYLQNSGISIVETNDKRKWSQPCARNTGGDIARGERLLFTDIDHILTKEAIEFCINSDADKVMFPRRWGVLTGSGEVNREENELFYYGLNEEQYAKNGLVAGMHHNTFMMKRNLFYMLDGYDERFCGKYGGDDTDFSDRYSVLVRKEKKAKPHVLGPCIYVYPDPNKDVLKIFHSLRR